MKYEIRNATCTVAPLFLCQLTYEAEGVGSGYPYRHNLPFQTFRAFKIDQFEAVRPAFISIVTVSAYTIYQHFFNSAYISFIFFSR